MSTQQTRTCKKCRLENPKDTNSCTQCGADLTPFSRRAFVITLGLTAVPLVITPILLLSSIDPVAAAELFNAPYIASFMFIAFMMVVYLVVGGIVSAALRRNNRSTARGTLIGLGVGLMLGAASCTGSWAAFV